MKVAAISLLSAAHAIPARRTAAHFEDQHDDRRRGDRRRQQHDQQPVRMSPVNRMVTGLAVQVIAQLDKPVLTDVAAARAAYRNRTSHTGEVINYQA